MSDQVAFIIVVCVTGLAFCFMGFEHMERVQREKEITNRILGTNGVPFKRSE